MSVIQEHLPTKREPLDKWSVREKLCLASAVAKSGDQNWMSVSRVLKPFADPNRPIDWLHQKNCAAQYNFLLDVADTPKRKKRESGADTPIDLAVRKLTQERIAELTKNLAEGKAEYQKMQDDMVLLKSGNCTMEMLNKWCREIDAENKRQEEEAAAHAQWLRDREAHKQEMERSWKPMGKPASLSLSLKRKASDSLEPEEESSKPALSPLLTSLLKSPSQSISSNATILNTSIGGATAKLNQPTTNPTIASILNSPRALQQLALQDPISIASDILEDSVDTLPNLKVDDLESSLLSDDPLPIMKNEDVEVIISNLIQANVGDDLKLDDVNVDIITNLQNELEEYCKGEEEKNAAALKMIDPFEFQEDPAICDIPKPSSFNVSAVKSIEKVGEEHENMTAGIDEFGHEKELNSGSVEIVEVVVTDSPGVNKELDTIQIQDIVQSVVLPPGNEGPTEVLDDVKLDTPVSVEQPHSQASTVTSTDIEETVTASDENSNDKMGGDETNFDEVIQVNKHDNSSSKRDYSRKKKDIEKESDEFQDEKTTTSQEQSTSDFTMHQMDDTKKSKLDTECSNSPWTEEEDVSTAKRRISAPPTPIDSLPTSPASSGPYFEDDRDYRNWKKSVSLVYSRLTSHKYASLFLKPITEDLAPGYHSLIQRPIDLQTIRKHIENGSIRNTVELRRDVLLMFSNALMYNKTNKLVYSMAEDMQKECMQHLDILLHAQQGDTPQRRETRTSEPSSKRKRPPEDNTRNKKKKEE